jgi:hypothetical protein
MLGQDNARSEVRTKEDPEEERRVRLSLERESVVSSDDNEPVAELLDGVDDVGGREIGRLPAVDVEDLLAVLDDSGDVDGERERREVVLHDERSEETTVLDEPVPLLVKLLLEVGRRDVDSDLKGAGGETGSSVKDVDSVLVLERSIVEPVPVQGLVLHKGGVHAVLSVDELEDVAARVSDGSVVLDLDVLERLDETTLDVSRLGRLDGGINETLSTSHGVEEELGRRETSEVRVLDEASGFGPVIVFRKMRLQGRKERKESASVWCGRGGGSKESKTNESTMAETKGDSLSLDDLLTDDSGHLGDVDERSLGPGDDHLLDRVGVLEVLLPGLSREISRLVEQLRRFGLERLSDRHSRLTLDRVLLSVSDQLEDALLRLSEPDRDRVHGDLVGDGVSDTDGEPVVEEPEVDDELASRDPVPGGLGSSLSEDDIDEPVGRRSGHLLDDDTANELSVLDDDLLVGNVVRRGRIGLLGDVDSLWDRHAEDLLSGPERLRLEDGGRWNRAVPAGKPEKDVLNGRPVEEGVSEGELPDAEESVLNDTHDGLVRLRGDDLDRPKPSAQSPQHHK